MQHPTHPTIHHTSYKLTVRNDHVKRLLRPIYTLPAEVPLLNLPVRAYIVGVNYCFEAEDLMLYYFSCNKHNIRIYRYLSV